MTSQLSPKVMSMPPEVIEQINACIANGKLALSTDAAISLVRSKISVRQNDIVGPMDVLEVLKTAVSVGLDPTSNDIFAFKSKNALSIGISKVGWSKILDARKGSLKYNYGPVIEGRTKISPSVYQFVQCTISKADGSVVEGPMVFNDEVNTNQGPWASQPKTMLAVRAFTRACALAYGIGAYAMDEARYIYDLDAGPAEPKEHLPSEDLALSEIDSLDALNAKFIALPKEVKGNAMIIDKFAKRKQEILNTTEVTTND